MNKPTRRGSLAAAAAIAVALAGATSASAADTVRRLGGADRIETAILASQNMYPNTAGDDSAARYVVIARYDDYADALAATPLAEAAINAPVLLTQPGRGLDPRVLAEVNRLSAENGTATLRVIIAGGEGVVSAAAAADLVTAVGSANVFRVGGQDRYETATDIADVVADGEIGGITLPAFVDVPNPDVYLARGDDFADALAAGAAAAEHDGVVLLTKGSALEFFTSDYLNNNATLPANVTAVGGSAATAAGARAGTKLVGLDRYETAKMVAETFPTPNRAIAALASGQNFPDAVVAGAWAAKSNAPVLLTPANATSPFTTVYFTANGDADVTIFGGPAAVSTAVATAIKATLDSTAPTATFTTSTSTSARTLVVTSAPNAQLTVMTKSGTVVASRIADTDGETIVTFTGSAAAGEVLILTAKTTTGAETAIEITAPTVLSVDNATVVASSATTAITGKASPGASVTISGTDIAWTAAATVTANATTGVYTFPVTTPATTPIVAGTYTLNATLAGAPIALPVTFTATTPAP